MDDDDDEPVMCSKPQQLSRLSVNALHCWTNQKKFGTVLLFLTRCTTVVWAKVTWVFGTGVENS